MRKDDKLMQMLFVVGLLLVFLFGKFSLSRLNLVDFQVRYALLAASLPILLAFLWRKPRLVKFSRASQVFFLLLFTFTLYSMISMFWLKDITVGVPKFVDIVFLFFIFLSLLVAIHTFESRDRLAVIVAYFFILVGLVYLSLIYRTALMTNSFRVEVYEGGYNVQTRVLFMSTCSSIFLFARRGRWTDIVLMCCFLSGIVLLASKQGIIGAALMLMVFLLLKMINRFKNSVRRKGKILKASSTGRILKILAVVSVSVLFLYDRLYRVFHYTIYYLREFFLWRAFTGEDLAMLADTGSRARLFVNSIETIMEHPWWGIGLAGYLDVPGIGFYPHNIALEFLLDGGILGGLFFLMFASYSIYIVLKAKRSIYLPFCLILPYMLIVSLVSSGLYDFRYYFMWIVISLYFMSGHHQSCEVTRQ